MGLDEDNNYDVESLEVGKKSLQEKVLQYMPEIIAQAVFKMVALNKKLQPPPAVQFYLKMGFWIYCAIGAILIVAMFAAGYTGEYRPNLVPAKIDLRAKLNANGTGDCIIGDRSSCSNHGDCVINSDTGLSQCVCDSRWYTYHQDDQCGYAKYSRWFAFTLDLFPGLGAEFFYLSRGNSKYIGLGVARFASYPVAVVLAAPTCYLVTVGAVGWMVWDAVQLGTNSGYLSYDGNGVPLHAGWVPTN